MGVRGIGLMIIAVFACGDGSSSPQPAVDANKPPQDAAPDAIVDTCATPLPTPLCSQTCGNGQLDSCFERHQKFGVCWDVSRTEMCDGEGTPTCAERGYFGDWTPCTTNCYISLGMCEACAPTGPNNLGCATFDGFRVPLVAASGALVAMSEHWQNVGPGSRTWVFDGLTKVAEVATPLPRVTGLVGVPNGWLLATSGSALHTFDAAATLGPARPIDGAEPALAYGPGQRVIVVWNEYVQSSWQAYFELVDTSGQIVLPKTAIFTGDGAMPGVAANTTSFYVGSDGELAKIASDGTRTLTTGFPTGSNARVTVDGTTGWYVALDEVAPTYLARHFDAAGTPVGGVTTLGLVADVLADGNDLLVLRYAGNRLLLDRIDPTGSSVASIVVGAGVDQARIVRAAGSLYVAWTWQQLRIAQVSI